MPTYDYHCENCDHKLEAFQKITDEPLKECPQCHKYSLVKGIGGGSATFQFQGNGFYLTDYKKEKPASSACCPCGKNKCDSK